LVIEYKNERRVFMKIAIDKGHTLRGYDSSADGTSVGGFCESTYNRILGDEIIKLLQQEGHQVVDVTVDDGNQFSSLYDSLSIRTTRANSSSVDLYISLHFNAGGGQGVEVYYASGDTTQPMCQRIQNNIVSLGFKNRGVKVEDFYVLTNVRCPALLIETCFCDSIKDKQLYDSLGHYKVAKAIVEGILNKNIEENQQVKSQESKVIGVYNMGKKLNMRIKYKENNVEVWTKWYSDDKVINADVYKNIIGIEIYTEENITWTVCDKEQKYVEIKGSGIMECKNGICGFSCKIENKNVYYWVSSPGDAVGYEWWNNGCKANGGKAICNNSKGVTPLNAIKISL
jgi:N-acetylmuramoyl-L-alanine amidase